MIIQDNGIIWGEENDRKDNLLLHFIDKCYQHTILGPSSCSDCEHKQPCEGNKKEIESRLKEIRSNIRYYTRVHKKSK